MNTKSTPLTPNTRKEPLPHTARPFLSSARMLHHHARQLAGTFGCRSRIAPSSRRFRLREREARNNFGRSFLTLTGFMTSDNCSVDEFVHFRFESIAILRHFVHLKRGEREHALWYSTEDLSCQEERGTKIYDSLRVLCYTTYRVAKNLRLNES